MSFKWFRKMKGIFEAGEKPQKSFKALLRKGTCSSVSRQDFPESFTVSLGIASIK